MSASEFPPSDSAPQGERLQKVLAAAGLASRRKCEEYIRTGRVTIDGKVVTELGVRVDTNEQKVAVDGERIKFDRKVYYLLNKPMGVLCTNSDPAGRPRVIDLFPKDSSRLFTVGRLDENTEGLLIVTNDGALAQGLTHPKFGIPRVYRALVAGQPNEAAIDELMRGLYFTEGKFRMSSVRVLKTKGSSSLLDIVMREGQNREIRRLLARVGHKVMRLKRVSFGPLKLGELEPGEFRRLTGQDLDLLRAAATGKWKDPSLSRPPRRPKTTTPEGTGGTGAVRLPRGTGAKSPFQKLRPLGSAASGESAGEGTARPRPSVKRPAAPRGEGRVPARRPRPEGGEAPEGGFGGERRIMGDGAPRPARSPANRKRPTVKGAGVKRARPESSRDEQGERPARGMRTEGGARPTKRTGPPREGGPRRPAKGPKRPRRDS